ARWSIRPVRLSTSPTVPRCPFRGGQAGRVRRPSARTLIAHPSRGMPPRLTSASSAKREPRKGNDVTVNRPTTRPQEPIRPVLCPHLPLESSDVKNGDVITVPILNARESQPTLVGHERLPSDEIDYSAVAMVDGQAAGQECHRLGRPAVVR